MNALAREASVFYALDLLDAEELRAFEDQLVSDPRLRREVIAWQDCIGDLSLAVPAGDPSAGLLASIHAEIDAGKKAQVSWRSPLAFWSGWATAACFAIVAAWLYFTNFDSTGEGRDGSDGQTFPSAKRVKNHKHGTGGPDSDATSSLSGGLARNPAGSGVKATPARSFPQPGKESERDTRELEESLAGLSDRLQKLRALHHQRFTGVPGQARLVIFEMYGTAEPGGESSDSGLLTARAATDLLASSASASASGSDPGNSITLGDGAFPGFGAINLALQQFSHMGFEAESAELGATEGSEPDATPGTGIVPNESPDGDTATHATPAATPDALMFFDETSGQGSLVLQDLAPVGERSDYQLWMVDPRLENPIPLAVLPPLEEGGSRIHFDLPGQGYAPSRFLLTEEPLGGSLRPSGNVILESPSPEGAATVPPAP